MVFFSHLQSYFYFNGIEIALKSQTTLGKYSRISFSSIKLLLLPISQGFCEACLIEV